MTSALYFVTSDLAYNNEVANLTAVNSPDTYISCVKETREFKNQGAVTYL